MIDIGFVRKDRMRFVALSLWGAMLFAVPQLYLLAPWRPRVDQEAENMAWFLNSTHAAGDIMATLALGGFLAALLTNQRLLATANAIAAGSIVASVIFLFALGAGEMWPLVVLLCFVCCYVAIFLGVSVPSAIRSMVARATDV